MSFDDLPENWHDLPLDTPGLAADVVDLVLGEGDRAGGCLGFVLSGPDGRMAQPCVLDDVTDEADPAELVPFLDHLTAGLAQDGGRLVFARGRPGSVLLTDTDRRWHQVVVEGCRRAGVPLVGAFLATPAVVRSFPEPLRSTDLAS